MCFFNCKIKCLEACVNFCFVLVLEAGVQHFGRLLFLNCFVNNVGFDLIGKHVLILETDRLCELEHAAPKMTSPNQL